MKVVIKLYKSDKTKSGFPIIIYFRSAKIRKRIVVGNFLKNDLYYYEAAEWDFSTECPLPSAKNYDLIYPKIVNWRRQFNTLMLSNETDINAYLGILNENDKELEISLLERQLTNLKSKNSVGVLQFFNTIIAEKKEMGSSIDMYVQTKREIEKYIVDDCSLNTINYEWLNDFILFKKKGGTGNAGIMVYLRTLRALYKEAQSRDSLNVKNDNPFLKLIKNATGVVEIEFKLKYFALLRNYTPKQSTSKLNAFRMKRAITIFIFQFTIGGHDFIDVANLKWKHIKNGRVKFRRYKNRNKPQGGPLINNKLFTIALAIIEKFGTKDNDRVFGFIPDVSTGNKYKDYRSNFSRSLKTVSDDLELPTVLRSKSTRYIFRSLAGEMLISDLVIMQLQGHKPKGVTFGYQKGLPNSIVDKFLKKILKKSKLY
ncbi:MAG: hypothetical protein COB01_03045 [Lutibacter sp.]|nr:MAG: hypothetical protein COB01_03045 [Lutibacter sp.]